jgi:methionyl-tRNA formyltransferase
MRVVFLGNAPWSVPSLEALASSAHRPVRVLTRSARRAGRGSRLQRTPVAEAAEHLGLPLMEIETVKAGPGFDALVGAGPEVLVVVAYGEILPAQVLDVPSVAPVNVHFSMLPKLRGAAPVQRAILEGLPATGVTTIRMDEGVDTGPILLRSEEPILPDDDAGTLGERLATEGGQLLVKTLDGLQSGGVTGQPQREAEATYAPKLTAKDRAILWEDSSEAVLRRIAALAPDPGAETRYRDRLLKVYRATDVSPAALNASNGPAGSILDASEDGVVVATGTGPVVLREVQPEGRRRMGGGDFARGYRPQPGEILG